MSCMHVRSRGTHRAVLAPSQACPATGRNDSTQAEGVGHLGPLMITETQPQGAEQETSFPLW